MRGQSSAIYRGITGAICLLAFVASGCGGRFGFDTLPSALTDEEFWTLLTELSESPGAFSHSDNLVSNESEYANTLSLLRPRGGAYIGVGPEQNFSYIARLEPEIAFIVDLRRENQALHLMYKALFEASLDRADFVSRLFSRARPTGADTRSTVQELFARYGDVAPSQQLLAATKQMIRDHLLESHAFAVPAEHLAWMDYALTRFAAEGPEIRYSTSSTDTSRRPSYRELMTMGDVRRVRRSYLASEESFAFVKKMHERNMIVPVVGDFSGARALAGIGEYIRRHASTVSAFYGSNVEVYLSKQQSLAFCRNLDSLPSHGQTWFLHSKGVRRLATKLANCFWKPGRPITEQ